VTPHPGARTRYVWPAFTLVLDDTLGVVLTRYPDGSWSGGAVVDDDAFHARLLGLTPIEHRLAHELAHHVVALAEQDATFVAGEEPEGGQGCPIIRADAHGWPQAPDAHVREWRISAFTYYALGRGMRDAGEWGALIDLQRAGVDLPALAAWYRWLFDARAFGVEIRVHAVHLPPPPSAGLRAA